MCREDDCMSEPWVCREDHWGVIGLAGDNGLWLGMARDDGWAWQGDNGAETTRFALLPVLELNAEMQIQVWSGPGRGTERIR